jgi:hypothetical protein
MPIGPRTCWNEIVSRNPGRCGVDIFAIPYENQKIVKTTKRDSLQALCIVFSGLGIGWLIGMSVSPVLEIVIGAVLATLLAIVGALAGLDSLPANPNTGSEGQVPAVGSIVSGLHRRRSQFNVLPLTFLILSIVAGSVVGVYARTNQWLATNPDTFKKKWKAAGLTEAQALQLLVRASYGSETHAYKEPVKPKDEEQPPLTLPVLFANVAPEECNVYRNSHGDELVRKLAASSDERLRHLTKQLTETEKLPNAPHILEVVTREIICSVEPK